MVDKNQQLNKLNLLTLLISEGVSVAAISAERKMENITVRTTTADHHLVAQTKILFNYSPFETMRLIKFFAIRDLDFF